MEYKIGEIFEYNSEWYQCVEGNDCKYCDLRNTICNRNIEIFSFNRCASVYREDKKSVIFKKLEKVGEPYEYFVQHRGIVMLQPYKLFTTPIIINGVVCNVNYDTNTIDFETENDLMMLPEKKEGWAKVRKDINLYDTKEEADRKMIGNDEYVTAKVCWEE